MKSVRVVLMAAGLAAVAGCVPQPAAPPPPPPPPPSAPAPPPPPPADWRDVPLTPGTWAYRAGAEGSQALFGPAAGAPHFIVRCDRARRQVVLSRAGAAGAAAMTIRTSFGARSLPATQQGGASPFVVAALAAHDRLLDSMVFSRGRFTVEVAGAPMLVIPSWPEPARVIEDCRG